MYPYPDRMRWFVAGRYGHLVRALDHRRRGIQDNTLDARIEAMRLWNRVRTIALALLSLGLFTTVVAWANRAVPVDEDALQTLQNITTAASTLSGVLTLAYLAITRLLNQIEADILAILTIDHGTNPEVAPEPREPTA